MVCAVTRVRACPVLELGQRERPALIALALPFPERGHLPAGQPEGLRWRPPLLRWLRHDRHERQHLCTGDPVLPGGRGNGRVPRAEAGPLDAGCRGAGEADPGRRWYSLYIQTARASLWPGKRGCGDPTTPGRKGFWSVRWASGKEGTLLAPLPSLPPHPRGYPGVVFLEVPTGKWSPPLRAGSPGSATAGGRGRGCHGQPVRPQASPTGSSGCPQGGQCPWSSPCTLARPGLGL